MKVLVINVGGLLVMMSALGAQTVSSDEIIWLEGAPDSARIQSPVVTVRTPDGHYLAGNLFSTGLWAEFDESGRFVRLEGAEGDGPGEFRRIDAILPVDSQRVVIASAGRFTLMTRDGLYIDSRPGRTSPSMFMKDSVMLFSSALGVHEIHVRVAGGEDLEVETTIHSALTPDGAGWDPTLDLSTGRLATVGPNGDGYIDGEPAAWNVLRQTRTRVTGDPPLRTYVTKVVESGALSFSIRTYEHLGEARYLGDYVPKNILLWDHRYASPRPVALPDGVNPFLSGSVIGGVQRDEFGRARVGIFRSGTSSITP